MSSKLLFGKQKHAKKNIEKFSRYLLAKARILSTPKKTNHYITHPLAIHYPSEKKIGEGKCHFVVVFRYQRLILIGKCSVKIRPREIKFGSRWGSAKVWSPKVRAKNSVSQRRPTCSGSFK